MASVTFVGILSEMVPSGILPQMSDGLGISESQVGFLVGVYALASAICAIPLVSATLAVKRKTLLMALLIGFAASNIVVAISSSYVVIVAFRVLGGICAGVMWPMIAAYGTRLVPENMHGKAITVIMSGNTLGVSLGLPSDDDDRHHIRLADRIRGPGADCRSHCRAVVFLPASGGRRKADQSNSPMAVLKMPSMLMVLLLTFLSVAGHYGIYTYITLLVEMIGFGGGIGLALLIFGIGSVLSVIVSAKYIDAYLRHLIVVMLAIGGIAMAMFLVFRGTAGTSHVAFFLWGLAFGPLVTMYQTAVSKQVSRRAPSGRAATQVRTPPEVNPCIGSGPRALPQEQVVPQSPSRSATRRKRTMRALPRSPYR